MSHPNGPQCVGCDHRQDDHADDGMGHCTAVDTCECDEFQLEPAEPPYVSENPAFMSARP